MEPINGTKCKKLHKQIGMFINNYGPDTADMELFVVQCLIVITGIVLNVTVILLVLYISRLRSVQGIAYAFNLSCVNCIFCCASLVTAFITKYEFLNNKHLCALVAALTTFLCVAASLSRCVVALDRYVYIADPLHYYSRASERTVACLILCLWMASACLTFTSYVPDFFYDGDITGKDCLPMPTNLYQICVLLLGVLCPLCYELYVYTRIFYWAFLHIQIMKQEANYSNQLRQRSVKDSYNVDLHQLELFTRASLLMSSTIFAINSDDKVVDRCHADKESDTLAPSWGHTLRRVTINSNVANYIGSMMKFGGRKSNESGQSEKEANRRSMYASVGSAIDKVEFREEALSEVPHSMSREDTLESLYPEDIYIEEELRRLSRKVEAEGFKVGSKALYGAIGNLLMCTELKAGFILFIVLGTLVGCWLPFIVVCIGQNINPQDEEYIYQRKIANILVFSLSVVDPIIYDFLHQPIRNAIRDEIKLSLRHRGDM